MAAVRTIYVTVASREGVLLSVNSGVKNAVWSAIILKHICAGHNNAYVTTFKTNGPGTVGTFTIYGSHWHHCDSLRRLPPTVQCDYYVRLYLSPPELLERLWAGTG